MITYENKEIENTLNMFLKTNKIPNIIFDGPCGSGKRTLVHNFILEIFKNNTDIMERNILYTDCAHSKGIKFIRNNIKHFSKTHIDEKMQSTLCKIIIMSNAEHLTNDAQSALRRCIEVFSKTTRFFFITENKSLLMAPILSRFCNIYVPVPIQAKFSNNYHILSVHSNQSYTIFIKETCRRKLWLKNFFAKQTEYSIENMLIIATTLYETGYSGLDIIDYIEYSKLDDERKYRLLIIYNTIKSHIRNEQLLIFIMLVLRFIRSNIDLENILFM